MSSSPTLGRLAEVLGMGKSTVQRALTGDPGCSPKTRERVLAMAAKLGYRPDPVFASMGSRRQRKPLDEVPLAYLESYGPGEMRAGGRYFDPAAKRAAALGYRLEQINLREWEGAKDIWKVLYARGFVGVILGSMRSGHLPMLLRNEAFPVVCCGRTDTFPFNTVRPAIVSGIHIAWRELLALGYRRIGAAVCRHDPEVEDDFSRRAAAFACLSDFHTKAEFVPPLTSPFQDEGAFEKWVLRHRPEVVLGFSMRHYRALERMGFGIPDDVGFASPHRDDADSEIPRQISGLYQRPALIAEAAVNLIDQMIRHGERGVAQNPLTITVGPVWVAGETLRSRAAGAGR
jgi:LacI family transcriptional regulator